MVSTTYISEIIADQAKHIYTYDKKYKRMTIEKMFDTLYNDLLSLLKGLENLEIVKEIPSGANIKTSSNNKK